MGVRPRPPCLRLRALSVCTRGERQGQRCGGEKRGPEPGGAAESRWGGGWGRSGPSAGEEVASTATEGLGGLWGGTLGWLRAAFCHKGRSRRVMPSEQVRSPTHVGWRPRARCAVKGQTWEVAEQTEVNGKWKVGEFTRARQTERGWFGEEASCRHHVWWCCATEPSSRGAGVWGARALLVGLCIKS